MNRAEEVRDAAIRKLSDADLLDRLLRDADIVGNEREAFQDMRCKLRAGDQPKLYSRQRAWAEEAARRVFPLSAADVPRGREVATPAVLQNLPKRPPPRSAPE